MPRPETRARPIGPATELAVGSSRAVGVVALVIGIVGLAAVALWAPLYTPFRLTLFVIALLVGAWRALDRRVRLAISPEGIRYADWGPALVPWLELSGYAWTRWRGHLYLQLFPRRPDELLKTFSLLGRFGQRGARWLRMPRFGIAVTPLAVSQVALEQAIARHLPLAAPGPEP